MSYRVGQMVWYWPPGATGSVPPFAALIVADMGPGAACGLQLFTPPGTYVTSGQDKVWASETTPDGAGREHRWSLIPTTP